MPRPLTFHPEAIDDLEALAQRDQQQLVAVACEKLTLDEWTPEVDVHPGDPAIYALPVVVGAARYLLVCLVIDDGVQVRRVARAGIDHEGIRTGCLFITVHGVASLVERS